MEKIFHYGIDHLTAEIVLNIARGKIQGKITTETEKKVENCYKETQIIAKGDKPVYAINTGFGSLCNVKIQKKDVGKLQENLLKSHSVGVGNSIDNEIAKMMMILKVHALSQGFSGISVNLLKRIIWHIDNNVISKVPEQGSVGASGDLCPLSHLFLPLIGLGELSIDNGKSYEPSTIILEKYNIKAINLQSKEGLALINGTQFMAAHGIKIIERLENCLDHADIIGALSIEGYLGSKKPFVKRLHELRPYPGAVKVAERLRKLLKDSGYIESHKNCGRVQDPYSFRCMPQVHGASRDAWSHLNDAIEIEINSVTDNPIIFSRDDSISGGLFHGQPIALPMDYAGLAAAELGSISDRRTYLLIHGHFGLPPYLIEDSGLNSGFMTTQYCSASLVSENKTQCFPASADSIPTSMGQEDHVSMGSISGRKTLRIIKNLENILAIELLVANQAMDFRKNLQSSKIIENIHNYYREQIPYIKTDEALSKHILKSTEIIRNKKLLDFFESK